MNPVKHGREKATRFGSSASLVGVFTEALPSAGAADKPAVIFLNSGILHRVGSCRLYVQQARALSAAGFHSLRFDYSGVGDSDQRRDSLSFEESAVVETREAMDYLAKTKGVERFVLMGLCSGADMAHETAVVDPRVIGLVMLDAWAYRNFGYWARHYGAKLANLGSWVTAVRMPFNRLRAANATVEKPQESGSVEYEMPKYVRVYPPRERVAADLKGFASRGVEMYYIWTGGLPEYNHSGQFASTFSAVRFGSLLREEHLPDSDHIVTGLHHQKHIVDSVVEWAQARFAGAAPREAFARSA